ncbi:hypothetical protein PT277_10040 [Acetobacteraceae bacterium ESL0709]|nr:hypothetical protein [Acetobacteraceae bacterium ESL0697]MDF7679021.1 hypothetical protein [Acetobacteraceae bacterium ESL0709]
MSRDRLISLEKLRKLREIEADKAKKNFARSLEKEKEMEDCIDNINNDINNNEKIIRINSENINSIEMINTILSYNNWLLLSNNTIKEKLIELEHIKNNTDIYRRDMIEANTLLESTNKLISNIKMGIIYSEDRKLQNDIDDIARNSFIDRKVRHLKI